MKTRTSIGASLILVVYLLLSGCVSETTGGFSGDGSPESALANYLQLSRGYLEQGDVAASKRHLSNAAAIDSNNSDVYGTWGLIYTLEGDLELADESFRRALRIDSTNSLVRNNYAAFLFANDRFEEAHAQLSRVVEDTSYRARAQAFENMGLAALRLNDVEDAQYAFGRALQLDANRMRSTLELAKIHLDQGNLEQAESYYNSYLTMQTFYNIAHSPRSLLVGIQLEQTRGDTEAGRTYATMLADLYPDSPEYANYRQSLNNDQ